MVRILSSRSMFGFVMESDMEHQYTITLGELQQRYIDAKHLFLCELITELAGFSDGDYEADVIEVFIKNFPRYIAAKPIDPYQSIIDSYIINPNVRCLSPRNARMRMFEALVSMYGSGHVLTFTIK